MRTGNVVSKCLHNANSVIGNIVIFGKVHGHDYSNLGDHFRLVWISYHIRQIIIAWQWRIIYIMPNHHYLFLCEMCAIFFSFFGFFFLSLVCALSCYGYNDRQTLKPIFALVVVVHINVKVCLIFQTSTQNKTNIQPHGSV